jgi:hypothetical protein
MSTDLIAPKGKYRVVAVETLKGPLEDYLVGDYASQEEAVAKAESMGDKFEPAYVYDDKGVLIHQAGSKS